MVDEIKCPKCKDVLPSYPRDAGSCTCGLCEWGFLDGVNFGTIGGLAPNEYFTRTRSECGKVNPQKNLVDYP